MNNVIAKKILTISLLFVMACGEEKTATSKEKTAVVPKPVEVKIEEKPIEEKIIDEFIQKMESCIQNFNADLANVKKSELSKEKLALFKSVRDDCAEKHDDELFMKLEKVSKAYNTTNRKLIDKYLDKYPDIKERYTD